jgi:hypothetical protein
MNLFEGEKIEIKRIVVPSIPNATKDDINDKYIRGDIRIVTEQARYPLSTIVTMLDSGDYNLNPEFQRRRRWSRLKQSRLIESFIMNVPIPPIFLYEVAYSQYEVMDGLQRLTAIAEFYKNKFMLTGLDQWPELNGMNYDSIPDQVRRGIDRRYLSSIILLQETARDPSEADRLKQLVFERINSGGDKLEPQESRNALYNGPLNQLCIKLARTESFCKLWGIPTEDDLEKNSISVQNSLPFEDFEADLEDDSSSEILHGNALYRKMQDVELVLRFFAYRQLADVEQGRLRDFLDVYLKEGNRMKTEVLENLGSLFRDTIDIVYDVLGDRAFYLLRKKRKGQWVWYERPTKVLYDPMMFAFSKHINKKAVLIEKSEIIKEGLKMLDKEKVDAFKGRSTNKEDIFQRMKIMDDFLCSFLE